MFTVTRKVTPESFAFYWCMFSAIQSRFKSKGGKKSSPYEFVNKTMLDI